MCMQLNCVAGMARFASIAICQSCTLFATRDSQGAGQSQASRASAQHQQVSSLLTIGIPPPFRQALLPVFLSPSLKSQTCRLLSVWASYMNCFQLCNMVGEVSCAALVVAPGRSSLVPFCRQTRCLQSDSKAACTDAAAKSRHTSLRLQSCIVINGLFVNLHDACLVGLHLFGPWVHTCVLRP